MYRSFFDAVLAVVQDALGADWTAHYAAAWQARVARIMAQVDAHHKAV